MSLADIKFRNWSVTFTNAGGVKKRCIMGGELMSQEQALAAARDKWADATVKPLVSVVSEKKSRGGTI